jgi:TldD protein
VVSAVASGDTGMQTGYESVGRTIGFELFDRYEVDDIARTAARRAVTKLAARPAPSGTLPVVIGPGGGGGLFHEACGHGLEKDLVDKGASVFRDRLGQQVASPLVTLVDDGTMAEEAAAVDRGTSARRSCPSRTGSPLHGHAAANGGACAATPPAEYQHPPMVRMTHLPAGADGSLITVA